MKGKIVDIVVLLYSSRAILNQDKQHKLPTAECVSVNTENGKVYSWKLHLVGRMRSDAISRRISHSC